MPPENEQATAPVGSGDYVVEEGDCMSSIAVKTGHDWKTVWNDPANEELKRLRKDPSVLMPGDRLTIPPFESKEAACATGKRHVFKRRGVPEKLRIRVVDGTKPRANTPYLLDVDGQPREGVTGGDGTLEVWISPAAKAATLFIDDDVYELALGFLDPVETRSGAIARLQNLGYLPLGPVEDDRYLDALGGFQSDWKIQVTRELDAATRRKLDDVYSGKEAK